MNTELLKSKLLEAAIHGKLVPQATNDEPASVLMEKIRAEKTNLVKKGKFKKKDLVEKPIAEEEIPFEIPESWEWCRIFSLYNFIDYRGSTPNKINSGIPLITAKNVKRGYNDYSVKDFISEEEYEKRKSRGISKRGDILFTTEAPLGNVSLADLDVFSAGQRLITLQAYSDDCISNQLMMYFMLSNTFMQALQEKKTGTTVAGIKASKLKDVLIPLPPLAEQKQIVSILEEGFSFLDAIANAKENLSTTAEMLRSKILQAAFDGTLTGNDYSQIIVTLGATCDIARGGSPRPIKEYLTTNTDGINWIKIGDTEKGGKYINSCKEKIIPEGVKKSRMVHKGDFLLTNSMSFGRPYISNIEGCVHDGWLIISPHNNTFDKDFLYYLLSSPYVYAQFEDKASGSTVSNLNIDKVIATKVPLPPLAEQKRIVAKIDELFGEIDKLTK